MKTQHYIYLLGIAALPATWCSAKNFYKVDGVKQTETSAEVESVPIELIKVVPPKIKIKVVPPKIKIKLKGPINPLMIRQPRKVSPINQSHIAKATMLEGVKYFEGWRPNPYICPGGVKTIGYGHIGSYTNHRKISKTLGEKILLEELEVNRKIVLKYVKVPLTPHQLEALTSFTFDLGGRPLRALAEKPGRLNSGNYKCIPEVMRLYCYAKGKKCKGLILRRDWEVALWNNNKNLAYK